MTKLVSSNRYPQLVRILRFSLWWMPELVRSNRYPQLVWILRFFSWVSEPQSMIFDTFWSRFHIFDFGFSSLNCQWSKVLTATERRMFVHLVPIRVKWRALPYLRKQNALRLPNHNFLFSNPQAYKFMQKNKIPKISEHTSLCEIYLHSSMCMKTWNFQSKQVFAKVNKMMQ